MRGPTPSVQFNAATRQFYARFTVEGRRKYFSLGADMEEAKGKLQRLMVQRRGATIQVQSAARGPTSTCSELFAAYRRSKSEGAACTTRHIAMIGWHLDRLGAFTSREGRIGEMAPESLQSDHVRSYLATEAARAWGPATLRHAVVHVKAAFRWAAMRRLILVNPLLDLTAASPPRKRKAVISRDQAEFLIGKCRPRWAAFFAVLYETGARPSELLRMKWEDINDSAVALHEHKTAGRTRRPRVIYLNTRARAALDKVKRELTAKAPFGCAQGRHRTQGTKPDKPQPTTEDLVFPGHRRGRPLYYSAPAHYLRSVITGLPAKRRAEFAGVTPYTFRRSRATQLIRDGCDPTTVAEILGNTPSVLMDDYVQATPAHVRKALEA